ncbi:hypothetical protein [uncultured Legionella sp.]|uniref:hypothetical protein n=1 Tax=uncultured Legionella sp. TaxID=210934 RepID=UPI002639F5C2|nr:hypothetical protein [uncultured Legionella sp.]
MFELFYNAALTAESPEQLSAKLYSISLDAIDPNPPFLSMAGKLASRNKTRSVEQARQLGANITPIAAGFVIAGNDELVDFYRTEYNAEVDYIALTYAFIGNHKKVDEYLTEHDANIHFVLQGYAFANNHEKVNEYLSNFHPESQAYSHYQDDSDKVNETRHAIRSVYYQKLLTSIGEAYALAGNADKAEEFRAKGASVDSIAKAFAAIGKHEQVEYYRVKHGANIHDICLGYTALGQTIPSFYRAINSLEEHGDAGRIVIDSLLRLKQGQDQYWNPYWMNSDTKLNKIVDAVDKLPQDANLSDILRDKDSELNKAMSINRLSPLTFLGRLGFYQCKSIQVVNEQLDKQQETQATLS